MSIRAEGWPTARLALARLVLAWERLWPALWPATLVSGVFLLALLFDLLPLLPGWLHALALAGFAVAALGALLRAIRSFRLPDRAAAARRLEKDSGLPHRPLGTLADRLAGGERDPEAAMLWRTHRRRMQAELRRLRLAPPRGSLARRDPLGLRALVLLLLIVGVVAAGGDIPNRAARAFAPDIAGFGPARPASLDLWVTPPAYTGAAPVFFSTGGDPAAERPAPARLEVPEGSVVLAQVHGGGQHPVLQVGEAEIAFAEIEPDTFRAEGRIVTGDRIAVLQRGRELGAWPLVVTPDRPPTIAFAAPPQRSERGALRVEYRAEDDYGVERVRGVIRRADGRTGPGDIASIEIPLPLAGGSLTSAHGTSYQDFTPHPWAGLPVTMVLEAHDMPGQTGRSEEVAFILPERIFSHPVARAIIEQRKRLTVAPEARRPVADALSAIGADFDAYQGDVVVALALASAARRLIENESPEAVPEVQSLLWDTALRLEEGDLAIAEAELRAAQQALQEALSGDATDEEIQRLMDRLQRAMDQYLQALVEQRMKNQAEAGQEPMPFDPNATLLQREDLQRMLDQAREMARSGAREAARDLLAQLQEMLENLRAQTFAGQHSPAAAEAMRMMRDLESLGRRQQELLDRSFRQSQQLQPGDAMPNTEGDAAAQEALRRGLGDIMRRFGELTGQIPRPLGRAERAMREATEALRQGDPGAAVDPQTRALSELQQGAQQMMEQMMQAFGQQQVPGVGQERFGQTRDPLGRTESGMGMIDTGDVEIPDKADLQRAREILDELRRRAAERSRPRIERDYIDRLLRRF